MLAGDHRNSEKSLLFDICGDNQNKNRNFTLNLIVTKVEAKNEEAVCYFFLRTNNENVDGIYR